MIGNSDVMCAVDVSGKSNVGPDLSDGFVAENPQCADKVGPMNISWNLQTANASSRTKCSRMIFGIASGGPSLK